MTSSYLTLWREMVLGVLISALIGATLTIYLPLPLVLVGLFLAVIRICWLEEVITDELLPRPDTPCRAQAIRNNRVAHALAKVGLAGWSAHWADRPIDSNVVVAARLRIHSWQWQLGLLATLATLLVLNWSGSWIQFCGGGLLFLLGLRVLPKVWQLEELLFFHKTKEQPLPLAPIRASNPLGQWLINGRRHNNDENPPL